MSLVNIYEVKERAAAAKRVISKTNLRKFEEKKIYSSNQALGILINHDRIIRELRAAVWGFGPLRPYICEESANMQQSTLYYIPSQYKIGQCHESI